jgi:hypothetical protein
MTSTIRTLTIYHGPPAPPPVSGVMHGVCLGPEGGAIATAETRDGIPTVTGLHRFGASLEPIAAAVRSMLAADPGCRVVVDRGLRGRELLDQIGTVEPRRRLQVFDAQAEDRRYEIGGRLSHAIEAGKVRIRGNLREAPALRKAVAEASRADAGDRVELVAVALAVIDRRPPIPRIG